MESFFDFLKGSGKAVYESYLYLVTMLFCMSVVLFVPSTHDILAILAVLTVSTIALATGRMVTFLSTMLLIGYLGSIGHFPILTSN